MKNSECGLRDTGQNVQYSQDTQDMLKMMMQEKNLTVRQKQEIQKCLNRGAPLPSQMVVHEVPPQPKPHKPVKIRPQRKRSAETCRSWIAGVEQPPSLPAARNWEKEKTRLQNIMETGEESPKFVSQKRVEMRRERVSVEEVLGAIEERKEFLAEMAALGQEKQYFDIINSEISQIEAPQKRARMWNTARPLPYNRELQERLRLQKKESDYFSLMRKQISESEQREAEFQQKDTAADKPVKVLSFSVSRKRTAENCRLWSSSIREPPNLTPPKDAEKEKRRLINIMAYGIEDPTGLVV